MMENSGSPILEEQKTERDQVKDQVKVEQQIIDSWIILFQLIRNFVVLSLKIIYFKKNGIVNYRMANIW